MTTSTMAIIVAAGSGERLGADRPKALVEVAGVPLLRAAIDRVIAAGIHRIIVTAPSAHLRQFEAIAHAPDGAVVTVVAGGATRSGSVANALAHVADSVDLVLVHDAARGFMPEEMIREVINAVRGDVVAAAPALPVTDTIKRIDGDGAIVATVDRAELVSVQTPQAFLASALLAAHATGLEATDDLALVERLLDEGRIAGRAVVTAGSRLGMKVTYRDDVRMLETMMEARA